jgi:hypothetical protein
VITDWALQSYLELKSVFTKKEYLNTLRPDAELLKDFPDHPKFEESKFWGSCKDKSGKIIHQAYKMKWHNIGPGRVQLRLLVVLAHNKAYLCNAYVKNNESKDFREMAKLKTKILLINEGGFAYRGRLL